MEDNAYGFHHLAIGIVDIVFVYEQLIGTGNLFLAEELARLDILIG